MLNIWASQQQGSSAPLPDPIAVADFKNDAYSLNGATKVLTDLFTLAIFTGDSSNIAVITGEGFKCEYEGTASASGWLLATSDLFDALTPAVGFTAVIDVSATVDIDGGGFGEIDLTLEDSNTNHFAQIHTVGGSAGAFSHSGLSIATYSPSIAYTDISPYTDGSHRLVISFDPAGLKGAADGGAVITADPFAALATADQISIYLEAILNAHMVVERVRFFALVTDPATLRRLTY